MTNNVHNIKTVFVGGNIFSENKYIIPLYQRAFAWEDKEIEQLIDDILNFETDNYYLGSLIVFERKDGKFEVIDGQQRLTALYLLLTALSFPFERNAVSFEYRPKSDNTLVRLTSIDEVGWRKNVDGGILSGFNVICKKILGKVEDSSGTLKTEELKRKLEKVNLLRVIVPQNTDLNKYFEIMNNRGEQLEQQDIVKSRLIEMITDGKKRDAFARIWDACSDMAGYVQMHFDVAERKHYFGDDWDCYPDDSDGYYLESCKTDSTAMRSISEIAESADVTSINTSRLDHSDEDNIRFESFLTFRHFLLHVLKIFEVEENEAEVDTKKTWSGELIDDKKLIQRFETVFPRKQHVGETIERFGLCLLRCRFLFDNFMLKREFSSDDTEGRWSLKSLKVSWSNSRKYAKRQPKAYYVDVTDSIASRMLQSMLRVTYTSPLVMHWATEFLAWLYFDMDGYDSNEHSDKLENIAKAAVGEYMNDGEFSIGLITPHIVFNYLDYLLWQKTKQDFQFEFRKSVEHWYPQHPIDSNVKWDEQDLNHFGNLCLISSGLNSKFSNNLPLAKKANFSNGIVGQSMKLRRMADLTTDANAWTEEVASAHGEEMFNLIRSALELD
ncbi:hypothetical protein QE450_000103 [Paenibacillus sp. SORGH_AS306]|uniref:DUF262 domain-containing protein n=1 Tax=unclassified Paenibacillus TaxID=185978 RepID=UPI00278AE093|nr:MULTISPECIES: DUF262 domain-containing HNH endonuclease family protein [unclassified Paenibacillus]MDQ1232605.1 hypothetical protein [Paenibacillus sp. SORGH_AS_0306]MDR6109657.1 hypothetical protein [Paenibacillus sp. SORGH_AS_0338]